jgi:hypothetical protein
MAPNQSSSIRDSSSAPGIDLDRQAANRLGLLDVHGNPEALAMLAGPSVGVEQTPIAGEAQTARSAGKSTDSRALLSRLASDVAQKMDSAHGAEFMHELDGFLAQAKLKNVPPSDINRTLEATASLLEGRGERPLSQEDRVWLATSLMHNLNHCDRVDQGFHNTCNVTAISKILMATGAAVVAEMVSSTALNGYYRAVDGKRIAIDAQSLEPDKEAIGGETRDHRRNYASQVFDLIAINNYWQRHFPPFSYIQRESTGAGDTGERLLNAFGQAVRSRDGSYLHQPNLDCRAMVAIGRELGIKQDFLVANSKTDNAAGVLVNSEEKLGQTLKNMLNDGHPAMVFVHSGNKLFTGKYGIGGGGWHVVTIDSFDPSTGKFHLSNQWGARNDQMVSIADLYDSTLPPSNWVKAPSYLNREIFEAYHEQMADGGAGLDRNQVLLRKDFDSWLIGQKRQMKEHDMGVLLNELEHKLQAARDAHDEAEVRRLESWIQQTRAGLR